MMKVSFALKYALLGSVIATAVPANSQNILYRNDSNIGTDFLDQAILSSIFTATRTSGDLSSFTLSDFDAVFYANQNSGAPAGDIAALASYISGGGRVIFNNWLADSPPLDSTFTGNNNQTVLTLTQFTSGVASPLSVVNPGWGTFSAGLMATTGGTVAATFENGDAAIVIGNSGRSIHNGFLTDTVDSSQLYANQFSFLFGSAGAVPEPATWALMLLGFAFAGASLRRRKNKVTIGVSYA